MHNVLPPPSTRPFSCSGSRGSVLLLHGFTGTPYEVKTVALALQHAGYACAAPVLPGHCTKPSDLEKVTAEDWKNFTQKAFESMPSNRPRLIVGLSMGALLATWLAAKYPDKIDGLVLISPSYVLSPLARVAAFLSRMKAYYVWVSIKKSAGSDIQDPKARRLNPSYKEIGFKSLYQFDRLRRFSLTQIPHVQCPVWVGFGKKEHTVDVDKAILCLNHFKNISVEQNLFLKSGHVLTLDFERAELIKGVLAFCEARVQECLNPHTHPIQGK